MNKQLFALVCSFLIGATASAQGKTTYICKNADSSVILTQTHLVVLKSKAPGEAPEMIVGTNASLNTLSTIYSDVYIQDMGYVKNINVVEDKGVVSQNLGAKCDRGINAGSQTKGYTIEARVALSKKLDSLVELNCIETSSWDTNCDYNN